MMARFPVSAAAVFLLICLCTGHAERVSVLTAVENPHIAETRGTQEQCSSESCDISGQGCQALGAVDPQFILNDPVATQADTLLTIVRKVYQGTEVPIYHFKQPHRLNPGELPFRLIRMSQIDQTGLAEIPVDPRSAHDSWFPDYYWDILVCQSCQGLRHLGWKFSPKSPGAGLSPFYALIIDYSEDKKREAESARDTLEGLTIGVRAPAWMITLATATLGIDLASQKKA